jgi:predicted LPLAT superfamily acyltransferase
MPMKDDQFTPMPNPEQAALMQELPQRVQSAIAFLDGHLTLLGKRHQSLEPKHLRVGVNSALVEASALGRLMLSKKLITAEEYFDMIIAVWREEVERYQALLTDIDPKIKI